MGKKAERAEKKVSPSKSALLTIAIAVSALAISFTAVFVLSAHRKPAVRTTQNSCDGTCVALRASGASPVAVTVATGGFAQFNSADGEKYNLSIDGNASAHHGSAEQYNSGDFGSGEAWRVQFKSEGAFTFKDKYHPNVSINVVVYTPGKDYKITR